MSVLNAGDQLRQMIAGLERAPAPARLSISALRHLANGDMQIVLSNGAVLAGVDVIELRGKRGAHTVLAIEVQGVAIEVAPVRAQSAGSAPESQDVQQVPA